MEQPAPFEDQVDPPAAAVEEAAGPEQEQAPEEPDMAAPSAEVLQAFVNAFEAVAIQPKKETPRFSGKENPLYSRFPI